MVSGDVGTWRDPLFRRAQRRRCRWLSLLVKFIENSHPSLFSVGQCQGHAFPCSQQRCGYGSLSCRCTGGRRGKYRRGPILRGEVGSHTEKRRGKNGVWGTACGRLLEGKEWR